MIGFGLRFAVASDLKEMRVEVRDHTEMGVVPDEYSNLVADPASYADPGKLHAAFSQLRAEQPVGLAKAADHDPFWLITKHADILEIEKQADIFTSGDSPTIITPRPMVDLIHSGNGSPHLIRSLVNMDGAEHRLYRALTQSWFMPGNVKKLSERLRHIAKRHVDKMILTNGECDFVSDVALHYPLHVVMEILGVPAEDEARMLMLTQHLFGAQDPDQAREVMKDPQHFIGVMHAVIGDFHSYFSQLSADRRASPRNDVATVVANAIIDGKPIAEREANSYYILLATAGHDTTSASTAGAIWALAERPDLLARLKANPALMPGFVEEAVRWTTPVKHFMRAATQDYELRGQKIRAGDWLMLSYMSANRDEEVFEEPFTFNPERPANRQLAFGFGPHVCVGQHLARLEMTILFEELLPRLEELSLAGEPAWTQSNFVSGPKTLPVRFVVR